MTRYIVRQEFTFLHYYHWSKTLPNVTHILNTCVFQGCHKMSQGHGVKEGDDGPGVVTDFILYVSANTSRLCTETTLATAGPCQLEEALDR